MMLEALVNTDRVYRDWILQIIWFSLLYVSAALIILTGAVLAALYALLPLQSLQTHKVQGVYHEVVKGGPVLRRFRTAYIGAWLIYSVNTMAALVFVALNGLNTVVPISSNPSLRLSEILSGALSHVFSASFEDPWIRFVARSTWIGYGMISVFMFVYSVGHLVRHRQEEWQGLLKQVEDPPKASEAMYRLSHRAKVHPVRLAVLPVPEPYVAAHCFGLWGREQVIAVSEGALEDFDVEELQALFAHELVHLQRGHCRTAVLLRWLGRLTFTGDAFVLALQNSFGYEQEADRLVLERGWASAEALERCLVKMRHMPPGRIGLYDAAGSVSERRRLVEQRLQADEEKVLAGGLLTLPLHRRWRLAWRLFRRQYFEAMDLHYWHPSYEERLAAVREWRLHAA